ncbi:MAG: hypothetical protein NUV57_03360 [archaeon]|nr:hypothetical protein [archaeon]
MSKFTEEQKKIALLLLHSPKTVEDLNKQLNIPYDDLNENLKQMVRLKLIKMEGYPQKYRLMENIAEAVKRRKDIQESDPFDLRLKAVIEFKAVEESFLAKSMDTIEKKLKESKDYTIYDSYRAEPIKEDAQYSAYLELNISAKDFTAIIKFMYFYGPSSVEVLRPKKVVLAMDDLQDALMEMAEMIQLYNQSMLKSMNKDELDAFAKNLYKPK